MVTITVQKVMIVIVKLRKKKQSVKRDGQETTSLHLMSSKEVKMTEGITKVVGCEEKYNDDDNMVDTDIFFYNKNYLIEFIL